MGAFRAGRRRTLGLVALGAALISLPGVAARRSVRVVTLFQGATDTVVALGITPVGVVESWQDKPIYPYLRQALAGVTLLGLETQPSLEDVALLDPDVIVASSFRHARIAPLLSQLGRLVMLDDIYRYRRTLSVTAAALGCEHSAMDWEIRLKTRIRALRQRLQRHFDGAWPISVSLLDVRANEVRSYLAGSFGGSVLRSLGFRWNPIQAGVGGVSLRLTGVEHLSSIDADVFFVMLHGDSAAVRRHYRELRAHPIWQRMSAPRRGAVVAVDPVAWSLSGGILGVMHMLDDIEGWLDDTTRRA
ncbi:iron-siderophore ABC transporter substrate-binding protein [Salinisphaera sp. Q1T1-3]|nr:iron-siderophore ABC transporter substrate-binding protein [Salinisphaera sp. Q1T1-3]